MPLQEMFSKFCGIPTHILNGHIILLRMDKCIPTGKWMDELFSRCQGDGLVSTIIQIEEFKVVIFQHLGMLKIWKRLTNKAVS